MSSYILAELYRIFHKKTFYYYLAFILIAPVVMLMMASIDNLDQGSMSELALVTLSLTPMVILLQVFSTVYGDDFGAGTIKNAIAYGKSKSMTLLSKFVVAFLVYLIVLSCCFVVFMGIWGLRAGFDPSTPSRIVEILKVYSQVLPLHMAYVAMMAFLLMAFKKTNPTLIVSAAVIMMVGPMLNNLGEALPQLKWVSDHSIYTNIMNILSGKDPWIPMAIGFIFCVIYNIMAITIFKSRDVR